MLSRFEQFSAVISGIYRYIQKLERDEMEKLGYKGAFAQYLLAIARFDQGVTASQLCQICDKDKAAISRVLAEMEEKGLICRRRDGDRGYRAKLCLTEAGVQTAEFVRRRAGTAVDSAGSGLTDKERAALYVSLDRIAGQLQHMTKEGIPQI